MNDYVFDPKNVKRVKLPERFIEKAVRNHLRAASKTRGKYNPYTPQDVIDLCELYISGCKGIEIKREYMPHREMSGFMRKWIDVFGMERPYAKALHLQNRTNSILGKEPEQYNYNPMEPNTYE